MPWHLHIWSCLVGKLDYWGMMGEKMRIMKSSKYMVELVLDGMGMKRLVKRARNLNSSESMAVMKVLLDIRTRLRPKFYLGELEESMSALIGLRECFLPMKLHLQEGTILVFVEQGEHNMVVIKVDVRCWLLWNVIVGTIPAGSVSFDTIWEATFDIRYCHHCNQYGKGYSTLLLQHFVVQISIIFVEFLL